MNKENVAVISGPSGVGKGTIIQRLLNDHEDFTLSTSATTRAPRENEVHGVNYHFLSDEEFDLKINEGAFIEWCHVHRKRYGTLIEDIEDKTRNNKKVLIEIDTQGAQKIRAKHPGVLSIFIAPPTFEELEKRLVNRNTESKDELENRLRIAKDELETMDHYDYIVINDDLDQAVEDVKKIVIGSYTETY